VLQRLLGAHLEAIEELARSDVIAARAKLALVLRIGALGLFGPLAAFGVALALACRRALALGRFPPPGLFARGALRVVEGDPARRLAWAMLAAALALFVCSLAAGALSWKLAATLLACRAT
jgi:hypothetical protein